MFNDCRPLPATGGAGDVSDRERELQRSDRAQVARVAARAAPRQAPPPHVTRPTTPDLTRTRPTSPEHHTKTHYTSVFDTFEIGTELYSL